MRSSINILVILGGALLGNAAIIDLGTAIEFATSAPSGISSTGATVLNGDLGTTGTAPVGFPPGIVNGTQYVGTASAPAVNSNANFSTAYLEAKALVTTDERAGLADVTGLTLAPGVYNFNGALILQGTLYLSGAGDYVFKIGTALTVTAGSQVILADGATACKIYWVPGTSATIGTTVDFQGNVLAGSGIAVMTGASVGGGLYAHSAITLDANTVTACG